MTFVVTFTTDADSDVPPHVQLKGALKDALRRHGMRCVDIAEHQDDRDKSPTFRGKGGSREESCAALTVSA